MGIDDLVDNVKDWWNTNNIEDTFKGQWDDFKDTVVDTVNSQTIGQLWDSFKDGADDVFTSGCEAIQGSEVKSGCCTLNKIIKCSARSLVQYGNDLKDLGGQAFQDGCKAIGGTSKPNDQWECDVEGETYLGKLVNGSGNISSNVCISIII